MVPASGASTEKSYKIFVQPVSKYLYSLFEIFVQPVWNVCSTKKASTETIFKILVHPNQNIFYQFLDICSTSVKWLSKENLQSIGQYKVKIVDGALILARKLSLVNSKEIVYVECCFWNLW